MNDKKSNDAKKGLIDPTAVASGLEPTQPLEKVSSKADEQSSVKQKGGELNDLIIDKALAVKQALRDKQPAVSLDDIGQQPQITKDWLPVVSMPLGLDPGFVDMHPMPDGPAPHLPRKGPDLSLINPGVVLGGLPVIDSEPNIGAIITPSSLPQSRVLRHLMDSRYVLDPVAITLSGGGALGAFEVGALDFIYKRFMGSEEGVAAGFSRPRPDIITATSIGSVNGAWIAQDDGSVDELKDLWFDLRSNDDMFTLNSFFRDLLGSPGEAIGKIVADVGWGVLATGLLPFGFLFFGRVGTDISDLYTRLNRESSIFKLGPFRHVLQTRERSWSPTGPGLRGAATSVGRDLQGHRIVFVRGYDDMLYAKWQLDVNPISVSTPWSPWKTLGGPISSDPVSYFTGLLGASADNPLRIGVIARLANERRYGGRTLDNRNDVAHVDPHEPNYNPFEAWAEVPPLPVPDPPYSSQPTIIQRAPDGRAWAFCRDEHRLTELSPNLSHRSFFSRWNGRRWGSWTLFGQEWMNFSGNIAGCSYFDVSGTEVLELFVRNWDLEIMYNFSTGGSEPENWEFWGGESGPIKANSEILVVLADDNSMVDVFWRGNDGHPWTRRKVGSRGSWGPARNLGGLITSNLSSGRNSSGISTIFARGLDGNLHELRQTSVNSDWPANTWNRVGAPPELTLLADPYTFVHTPTTLEPPEGIEVYAVASDHSIWTIRQQGDGTYTDWISLGGKIWTGIQVRMSTVALETGEDRFVDEAGRFAGTLEPIISGEDGDITFSRTNGIIASCSLPGLFPPVRLNGRSWIDGGVRRGVPIGAAIDAGAKKVIAISTAPTKILPVERMLPPVDNASVLIEDYSDAGIIDIAMRSLMTMVDGMHWVELNPETKWPIPVQIVQPTFKIKGGEAVDPALISINYAYGWMRAFDILMAAPEQREAAMASTDRIINLRCAARTAEMKFREQYLIATMGDFIVDAEHRSPALLQAARQAARLSQTWLGQSRNYKWELRNELVSRRDAGFLVDPESPGWLAKFEKFVPQLWGSGWERLLRIPESPFEEITITVTIERTVGGSVGFAPSPTFDG